MKDQISKTTKLQQAPRFLCLSFEATDIQCKNKHITTGNQGNQPTSGTSLVGAHPIPSTPSKQVAHCEGQNTNEQYGRVGVS